MVLGGFRSFHVLATTVGESLGECLLSFKASH